MNKAWGLISLIAGLSVLVLALSLVGNSSYDRDEQSRKGQDALLQVLGMARLAISADCTATVDITEGLCGCLGDVPGGYCYHTSCDLVDLPEVLRQDLVMIRIIGPAER